MSNGSSMLPDLEIMAQAVHYNDWLFSFVAPYVGNYVVEIGAGIGTFTHRFLSCQRVVCVEPMGEAAQRLRERFRQYGHIEVFEGRIDDKAWVQKRAGTFDTAICLNVLEHIEDDTRACEMIHALLAPGGYFAVVVPALPLLYGTIDKAVGHFRRYARPGLRNVLETAGFSVVDIRYMNVLGVPGWFLTNRILQQKKQGPRQVTFFDLFVVPVARRLEALIPPPFGMSLVAIARKS